MSDLNVNHFNNVVSLEEKLSNHSNDLYSVREDLVGEVVRLIELISELYSIREELINEVTSLSNKKIKTNKTRKTNNLRRIK